MDYLKIDEVAAKWGISPRRLQTLCAQGKIEGATRFGRAWMIPYNCSIVNSPDSSEAFIPVAAAS